MRKKVKTMQILRQKSRSWEREEHNSPLFLSFSILQRRSKCNGVLVPILHLSTLAQLVWRCVLTFLESWSKRLPWTVVFLCAASSVGRPAAGSPFGFGTALLAAGLDVKFPFTGNQFSEWNGVHKMCGMFFTLPPRHLGGRRREMLS